MFSTPDLITRSDRDVWPTAIDPMTKTPFEPAFIYRNHAGQQWVVSTITDGNGKHEDEPGFNPARWPQWVALAEHNKADVHGAGNVAQVKDTRKELTGG